MPSSSPESSMATLSLSFPDHSTRLALSIPVSQVKDYAEKPLRWLRYIGFTIAGQKGRLSTSSAGPEIDDYDAEIEARGYFFILDGEPCLVDVRAMNDRTSVVSLTQSSSSLSSTRSDHSFEQRIKERDEICVLTDEIETFCVAAHVIPRAKGSLYMQGLSNHRGGIYNPPERIDNVNDIRNGLLVDSHFHRVFGGNGAAFLKTPNFGLGVKDIPPSTGDSSHPENRLTLQYFPGAKVGIILPKFAPHNSDVRQPEDTSKWPTNMLFDLSYAASVLEAWGSKDFIQYAESQTKDIYYPRDNNLLSSGQPLGTGLGSPSTDQKAACSEHLHTGGKKEGQETKSDTLDMVLESWKSSARVYSQQHMQDVEAAEHARSKDRVEKWLQSAKETA